MKIYFQFFGLLFLLLFPKLHAQRGVIEGMVLDAEGLTPMEYAQVGIYLATDSAFVDGTRSAAGILTLNFAYIPPYTNHIKHT